MTSSPTPSVSSPSTSPMCDDLETYQANSNSQRTDGQSIQSVSTPTSINPLLEPSTTPKATGKSLSHSTGVSMESPTRQTPPARTSLGPAPTGAAVVPPTTQGAPRTPGASSGSPKDRSDKEKEKTSFRREFMKIFGTISDAVSLDKKPSDKAAQLQSATSPAGTPPPTSQHYFSMGDGKSDPKKAAILHKSSSYVEHSTPPSNATSMSYGSASASASPYTSSRDLSSSLTLPNLSDSMGADTSTSAEEQIGSFRLAGSIPTDENSPLLNPTTTATAPSRPAPKMVTYYVEDLLNGESQSRFIMQASLLEPIFTAPFADLELAPSEDASLSTAERHRLLLDRAKCADLFSAGCIIYQLLSGMPLFHKDNIIQYLQGDGTWWWGTASQAIPRRFKALVFELILAGRPYFLYALQSGVSLGYVARAMTGTANTEPIEFDAPEDPFDFGVTSVPPTLASTTNTAVNAVPSPSVQITSVQELGHLSNNILGRFLNDDLISSPTSMKVFPSYFEQVYQFLARYHSTASNKNRIKLATDHIGFLVNLPMSGLELILPDLLVFFDNPDTAIEALALIEPLAIKLGRILTISKLLGPILGLYERMQQTQQGTQGTSSSSATSTSTAANYEKTAPSRHLELALELLSPRFVHTLLAKFGQGCFLKHIVGFLVNEIRSTKKEMSFAAGSAILRLVSVLSPPIFIRYILYPLLAQLNKANTEVLNATLVEIGARMGEDVIVRHHMEVIIPLLQTTIFNKDAISIRTSTSLLKLISSLVAIIHPTKIVNSVMVDNRCMFSILLTPPTHDKHLAEALLDCLTSIYASMGLHLAIKYARPYIQQFFTIFSNTPAGNLASGENPETDPKSIYYPTVLARFKDLLEVRSGGGNVSIQHALGPATRIESYLMGPVAAVPHVPSITASLETDPHHPGSVHSNTGTGQQTGANISVTAANPQAPQPRQLGMEKSPSQTSLPESTNDSVTTGSGSSKNLQVPDASVEAAPTSAVIAPRRLSSPVRPISPTLSVLATPPVPEAKEAPSAVLRLTTMNEDGYVADHMPNWLASMQGVPYTPAPVATIRPVSTMGVSGGMSSSTAPTGPSALATGISTGPSSSATAGGDKSGAKKSTLMPTSAGVGGVTTMSSNSAWDSSRDYETQSTPFVLNSFGPPTPSTHGAGWPPALGPQQSWNFSGQIGHTFKEHSNAIRCVFVHDNERLFLTGSKDTTVKCWDMLSEGSSRQTYTGHRLAVTHAEFVDRGNLVASCDGSVHVWELERGTKLASMEAAVVSSYASNTSRDRDSSSPSTSFTTFSSHQDGRVLVCGTSLSTITFTDLRAEQEVVCEWYLPTNNAVSISSTSPGSMSGALSTSSTTSTSAQSFPRSISLGHLDQNLIVVGQSSGHITLIDIRSGLLLHNWRAHDAPITSLKSVPECPGYFVSASLDKTMALWDISNASKSSPAILTHFKGHSDPHISFDIFKGTLYSVSGQKISIAPLFGQAATIILEKRKLVKTNALKLTNYLTSFNVLQSQHLALVGADDGTIKVLQ